MEAKHLRSRRKAQEKETSSHPPLKNIEVLKLCNGDNDKIAVIDNYDPTFAKNSKISVQNSIVKKDKKLPKNKPVTSSLETAPAGREVITIGSLSNNLNSLKFSPTDSKNINNFHPKRPSKLAPLDLPAQVKEAQIKKITAMADNVYVNERKPQYQHCNTPYHCPTKSDPLKKIRLGENKLPRLPEDVNVTKDKVMAKDSSLRTQSLPQDLQLGGSGLSLVKAESRQTNNSISKTVSPKINESRDVLVQGQFRSTSCHNTCQGQTQVVTINGPAGDYTEMRTIGK